MKETAVRRSFSFVGPRRMVDVRPGLGRYGGFPMRFFPALLLAFLFGCPAPVDDRPAVATRDPAPAAEGEGEAVVGKGEGEGEGEAVVGEGEGEGEGEAVVGEGEGEAVVGEGEGEGEPRDGDGDGVIDGDDNCAAVDNGDQADLDADGAGDACDDDDDDDGVVDGDDNCAAVVNVDQADADADDLGDACDADRDGDGLQNANDNCPDLAGSNQSNLDGDSFGDACDDDDDGDGVLDVSDNCPSTGNGDQRDQDGDGQGDACDGDRDGDGVDNASDNCVDVANGDQADGDDDGRGAVCDEAGRTFRLLLVGNSNYGFNTSRDLNRDGDTSDVGDAAHGAVAAVLRDLSAQLPADADRVEPIEKIRFSLDARQLLLDENRPCPATVTQTNNGNVHCPDRCRLAVAGNQTCSNDAGCPSGNLCIGLAGQKRCAPVVTESGTCSCIAAGLRQTCAPCDFADGCREVADNVRGQPRGGTGDNGDFRCEATASSGCSSLASVERQPVDAIALQLLPFNDSANLAAGGGVDQWQAVAVDHGAQLLVFLPMPATANRNAILGTMDGMEAGLTGWFSARPTTTALPVNAGRAIVSAVGVRAEDNLPPTDKALEFLFIDALPDGSLQAASTPSSTTVCGGGQPCGGGGHPGAKASYVYAVMLWSQLTGRSPIGLPTEMIELSPEPCFWLPFSPARCEVTPDEGLRLQELAAAVLAR